MQPILQNRLAFVTNGIVIAALLIGLSPADPAQARPTPGMTLINASAPADRDDEESETSLKVVKKSGIAPINLPEGAFLFTSKKSTADLLEALQLFAKRDKVTLGATEVLVWPTGDAVQKDFADLSAQ